MSITIRKLPVEVWLARVYMSEDTYSAVYLTEDDAWKFVDEWVKYWWSMEMGSDPLPDEMKDRVRQYYNSVPVNEGFTIMQVPVVGEYEKVGWYHQLHGDDKEDLSTDYDVEEITDENMV